MSETNEANLIVYRGWPHRGRHVWSPFVIKLEARLRFAGVSYVAECGSTSKAPKGKIPYIECRGLRGAAPSASSSLPIQATLGDSTLIIKQLVEWDILPNVNA